MSPSLPRKFDEPASPTLQNRRVLVTGGAGFIGSHLVEVLLARGDTVTVVDNLSTGRRTNLPQAHPRLRFMEADLRDALHAFGKGEVFDQIYHLAAAVGVRLVIDDPIGSIETNVEQTAALLRFASERGSGVRHPAPNQAQASPGCPTLIASSSEVYGKASHTPFREDDDVVYGPTTKSRWSYACSKAIDEFLALAYAEKRHLPVSVVRFFNTVGPRQVGEYGMVLPRFVQAALSGQPIEVHGDGLQSRCFCDVRDVVRVLPALLESSASKGRVFNVGSERVVTIHELAEMVVRTLKSRSEIRLVPYAAAWGGASGDSSARGEPSRRSSVGGFEDLRQRRPDVSRLRDTVGWNPMISLEQTISDLAQTMRAADGPVAVLPREGSA